MENSEKFRCSQLTLALKAHCQPWCNAGVFLCWNRAFVNDALWLANTFASLSCEQVYLNMKDTVKMQGTIFIFQTCAVTVAFNSLFGIGEGRWWYFKQAKISLRECIPTASKSLRYFHTKRSKHNLTCSGIFFFRVLNKTCYDNRMLWKQRRLFSRTFIVTIHKMMLKDAKKNYLSLHDFRRERLGWKWVGTVARLTIVLNGGIARAVQTDYNFQITRAPRTDDSFSNGKSELFDRMTILLERISLCRSKTFEGVDCIFFPTDSPSCSNGWQVFLNG